MSNRTILLAAGGLAFLYFISKSVMDLNRLLFSIAGVKNFKLNSGTVTVQIDILIQNPTGSSFPLYDTILDADVLVNNYVVGHTATAINALLVPGQQIVVPLQLTLTAGGFAGGIAALFASLTTGGTWINILGAVKIKGVPLPLNITYRY